MFACCNLNLSLFPYIDSLEVIKSMISQVLDLHPLIQRFHIGCDEVTEALLASSVLLTFSKLLHLQVMTLGLCQSCKSHMQAAEHINKDELFLYHVDRVATLVKSLRSDLTCIIWDDMLRGSVSKTLRCESRLPFKISLVLYQYSVF